eukprot:366130-Chlamydomonas_euryale.AAC.56
MITWRCIPAAAAVLLRRLATGLDRAMAMSFSGPLVNASEVTGEMGAGRGAAVGMRSEHGEAGAPGGPAPPSKARQQFVHNMQVVRACPMYGYYAEERLFIKVSM